MSRCNSSQMDLCVTHPYFLRYFNMSSFCAQVGAVLYKFNKSIKSCIIHSEESVKFPWNHIRHNILIPAFNFDDLISASVKKVDIPLVELSIYQTLQSLMWSFKRTNFVCANY